MDWKSLLNLRKFQVVHAKVVEKIKQVQAVAGSEHKNHLKTLVEQTKADEKITKAASNFLFSDKNFQTIERLFIKVLPGKSPTDIISIKPVSQILTIK